MDSLDESSEYEMIKYLDNDPLNIQSESSMTDTELSDSELSENE